MPGEDAFLAAARRGDAAAVAAALRAQPGLARAADGHGKTGLHWAAEQDHEEVARALLDAGADLEAATAWGATPLAWAAVTGSARVAALLRARGARGWTLVAAAGLGELGEVRAMLASGAPRGDPPPGAPGGGWPADAARMRGDAVSDALVAAARNGHAAVVAALLDAGADVDAKGFLGGTALHWAAMHSHAEVVDLLLARGARADLRDARFGATPAGWAREGGHADLAAALARRGGA